jgi:pyridoxine 5-phosphate synthase
VLGSREALHAAVSRLHEAGILVSLFIDPELSQMRASRQAGADAVEIHTGAYCEAFRNGTHAGEFERIRVAAAHGTNIGLRVFAGHGLDVRNILPILSLPEIEEFNIGHSIIARAVFIGLGAAVREMADLIHGAS